MNYKVNEIFESFQGEGFHSGRKTTFIRLSGCNLKCEFCDTKHEDFKPLSTTYILRKVNSFDRSNHIVITGGEPLMQNLDALILSLKKNNYESIAIETNGTILPTADVLKNCWITVSPKQGSVCKIKYADEVKIINYNSINLLDYEKIDAKYYYLNPVDINNVINYEETYKRLLLTKTNKQWRLGCQLHKIYKIT